MRGLPRAESQFGLTGCIFVHEKNTQLNLSLGRKEELLSDPSLKSLVAEQTKEWSELVGRHLREEWTMLKEQLETQQELLKTTMQGAQAAQMKQLEAKCER